MLITRSNNFHSGTRQRTLKKEIKLGSFSIKFATVVLLAVAALFYLAQSTHASAQKYQIMELRSKEKESEMRLRELEVESARLKSLNEIKNSTQNMNLEPVRQ